MTPLDVYLDVQNVAHPSKAATQRRLIGLLPDKQTLCVATNVAGETAATTEITFDIGDAVRLAEQCLTGDPRALTTPGLARILSASVAVLFRVSLAAGGLGETQRGRDDDSRAGAEAAGDDHSGS